MLSLVASLFTSLALTTIQPLPIEPLEVPVNPPQRPAVTRCFVGGCSGELCTSDPSAVSTCVYKEEYACLGHAHCEFQGNGECGWTYTTEYNSCLIGANPTPQPIDPSPSTPTHAPTNSPAAVCGNNVCEPNEYIPCPPGAQCIWAGSCPGDCDSSTPSPTQKLCSPRPACLDSNPSCLMGEPESGWCPPTPQTTPPTPTIPPQSSVYPTPTPSDPTPTPTKSHSWFPLFNFPPTGVPNTTPIYHLKPDSPVFTVSARFSQSLSHWWHGFSHFLAKNFSKVF